jgi:hypothetical protein
MLNNVNGQGGTHSTSLDFPCCDLNNLVFVVPSRLCNQMTSIEACDKSLG